MCECEQKITKLEMVWRGAIQFMVLNLIGVLLVLTPLSMFALGMAGAARVEAPFWLMPLPLIFCSVLAYLAYLIYRKVNRFPISWNLVLIVLAILLQLYLWVLSSGS